MEQSKANKPSSQFQSSQSKSQRPQNSQQEKILPRFPKRAASRLAVIL